MGRLGKLVMAEPGAGMPISSACRWFSTFMLMVARVGAGAMAPALNVEVPTSDDSAMDACSM